MSISLSDFQKLKHGDVVIWWPPKNKRGRLRTVLIGPSDHREPLKAMYVHFPKLARGIFFGAPSSDPVTLYDFSSMKDVLTYTGASGGALSPEELERLQELNFGDLPRVLMEKWTNEAEEEKRMSKWRGSRLKCGVSLRKHLMRGLIEVVRASR